MRNLYFTGCISPTDDSALQPPRVKAAHPRRAHTEQYQALAAYFRGEEKLFNGKAVAEKVEWDRRTATVIGPEIKSRSVESARNLYEYYAYEAAQMDTLAAGYEQRSR